MAGLKAIVIADDHPLFRAALRQAVEGAAPGRPIIETSNFASAREAVASASPVLVCLDLHMGDSDGFAGLITLRQDHPATPVAVVSGSEAPSVIRRAMRFGAAAFIPKSLDIETIRRAIAAVLDGDAWTPPLPPETAQDDAADDVAERLTCLTPTQLKVLIMAHQGLLNKQIAFELSISEATVKAHMTAVFRKLNVQTRTQAVIAAAGLLVDAPSVNDGR